LVGDRPPAVPRETPLAGGSPEAFSESSPVEVP
jgi:hypothetical protein